MRQRGALAHLGTRARLLALATSLGTAACATYDLIALPLRDADLYPTARTVEDVSVAAQAFTDPFRVHGYFGANLLVYDIVPIEITVSNHADRPIRIEPAGVLVVRGEEVVDPLPVEIVAELPTQGRWFVSDATREQLREFYADLSLREVAVAPGSTYHGVMFFRIPEPRTPMARALRVWQPFSMPTLHLYAAVEVEQGERLRFGPFGLLQ
jgi:hypothetical protein